MIFSFLLNILRLADDKGILLNRCLAKDGCCTHRGHLHRALRHA
jgi:hypothetical protein